MQPEKWKTFIDNKKRDENLYSQKIDANTDNFTCRKCIQNVVVTINYKHVLLMNQ